MQCYPKSPHPRNFPSIGKIKLDPRNSPRLRVVFNVSKIRNNFFGSWSSCIYILSSAANGVAVQWFPKSSDVRVFEVMTRHQKFLMKIVLSTLSRSSIDENNVVEIEAGLFTLSRNWIDEKKVS